MSQENAETVERAFEAWNRGDIEAYVAHLCPDVEAVPVGAALEGKVCRGRDEVRAWWQTHSEVWETFLIFAAEFEEVGEELLVSGHWDAVSSPHLLFGYDMKRGVNGIWYAAGIFAGR